MKTLWVQLEVDIVCCAPVLVWSNMYVCVCVVFGRLLSALPLIPTVFLVCLINTWPRLCWSTYSEKRTLPFSLLPLSLMPFLKLRLPHPALQQIKVLSCHLKYLTLLVQNNVRTAAEKTKHTQKIARVYRSACKCKTKLKIAGLIAIPDR